MSLRIDMYLDLPNNPKECIYEEKRDSWFCYAYGVQPRFSNKQDMLHIHSLNILLQYTYGDEWIDLISFNDEKCII